MVMRRSVRHRRMASVAAGPFHWWPNQSSALSNDGRMEMGCGIGNGCSCSIICMESGLGQVLVHDEDTQPLETPIIAPVRTKNFDLVEKTPPVTTYPVPPHGPPPVASWG